MRLSTLCLLPVFLLVQLGLPLNTHGQELSPTPRMFRVSAYYSPLPGQSFYAQGSYEAELRMNGMGIAGASGKPVYPGMLAAPKTYAFGTKIKLEGIGIGTVTDRGGAIVQAGQRNQAYDRIDVWMGYGEEGLKRALTFGKQNIQGYIYPAGTAMTDTITVESFAIANKAWPVSAPQLIPVNLGKGSTGQHVKTVQESLKKLGYFHGEVSGTYGAQTIDAVYDFQIAQGILNTPYDQGAGYMGSQTRKALEKALAQPNPMVAETPKAETVTIKNEVAVTETIKPKVKKELLNTETATPKVVATKGPEKEDAFQRLTAQESPNYKIHVFTEFEEARFNRTLSYGDRGEDVMVLQQLLKDSGNYKGIINGIYDSNTRTAVMNFQVENKIIATTSDFGAGYFGSQTKSALLENQTRVIAKRKEDNFVKVPAMALGVESSGEEVRQLQAALQKLNYLNVHPTGYFGEETKKALIGFQIDYSIIPSHDAFGAGFYGPQTQLALQTLL